MRLQVDVDRGVGALNPDVRASELGGELMPEVQRRVLGVAGAVDRLLVLVGVRLGEILCRLGCVVLGLLGLDLQRPRGDACLGGLDRAAPRAAGMRWPWSAS